MSGLSRDPSGDRLTLARSGQMPRSESRMSAASGVSGLPDLELDLNIPAVRDQSGDRAVHRTVSLLVTGVDMDTPADLEPQLDVVAKREEVLREIEEKKLQIREAKGSLLLLLDFISQKFNQLFPAWIQNGLMTVVGFGVMVYLQTLESLGP